jgi:peptidoglycan/xylan/chitin deacetylase (PgdA/CDA1 family)
MRRKVVRVLKNPLVIVPPFVIILGLGWQQYTYAGRNLNLPTANLNLLPNGGFTDFTPNGIPVGWQVSTSGDAHYETTRSKGYAGGGAFKVSISNYHSGDTAITSPKIATQSAATYLFKGYYAASTQFTLLRRDYYKDGSTALQFVRTYPGNTGVWSTAGDAFMAPANATAVQFVYRIYANGSLQLNSLYLEPLQNVYVAPVAAPHNIIPNGTLAAGDYASPQNWSTYHSGNNTAVFSYNQDALSPYVQAQISSYHDGEAKWQYAPQSVTPHQYYQFSFDYQSDTSVSLVAEYTLENGQRQEQTVAALPPADQWTTITRQFEVLPGAATMFLSAPLKHDGRVASRNYTLTDITKSDAARWQHAVVSMVFDDSWEQTYKNAAPLLQRHGYAGTFYVNPSLIETPDFMTANELNQLRANGNEIGSQGYDHRDMTTVNDNELDHQLRQGRDYLRSAGFQVTDFAAPYGRSDAEVRSYAQKYYTTLIGTQSGINTLQNLDLYDLKVLNVTTSTDLKTIETALKNAQAEDGWLILAYHLIGDDSLAHKHGLHSAVVSPSTFGQQIELIHKSGLRVLPVAAAYAELQKK